MSKYRKIFYILFLVLSVVALCTACGSDDPEYKPDQDTPTTYPDDTKPDPDEGDNKPDDKPSTDPQQPSSYYVFLSEMAGIYVATDGSNDHIIITTKYTLDNFRDEYFIVSWGGKYTSCEKADKLNYDNGKYVLSGNLNLQFLDFKQDGNPIQTLKIYNPECNQTKEFKRQSTINIAKLVNYEYETTALKKVVAQVYNANSKKLLYSTVLYEGTPDYFTFFDPIWISPAMSNVKIICTDANNHVYSHEWTNVPVTEACYLTWGRSMRGVDKINNLEDIYGVWLADDGSGDWILAAYATDKELPTNRLVCFWNNEMTDLGTPLFVKKDENTYWPYYELVGSTIALKIKTFNHHPSDGGPDYMRIYNPKVGETKVFNRQPKGSMARIKYQLRGSYTIGMETVIRVYTNGNYNNPIYTANLGKYSTNVTTTPFWLGGVKSNVEVTFTDPKSGKSCTGTWKDLDPTKNYELEGSGTAK